MNVLPIVGIMIVIIVAVAALFLFVFKPETQPSAVTGELVASNIIVDELDQATQNISIEDVEIAITE